MAEQTKATFANDVSRPVVMFFPNLYEAKAVVVNGKTSGKARFSANFLFDADNPDLKVLSATIKQVAATKWPGRELSELHLPLAKGDKLADKAKAKNKDGEFQRGKWVLVARSDFAPQLAVVREGKVVEQDGTNRIAVKNEFYPGVKTLIRVTLVPYDAPGNGQDGITAYLDVVVSTNVGKRLAGSGPSAAEIFKGYVGVATDEDPTAGASSDDEIPY